MEEAVQLGFESSQSQIPVLIDRFFNSVQETPFSSFFQCQAKIHAHIILWQHHFWGSHGYSSTSTGPIILLFSTRNTFHTYFTKFWIFLFKSLSIHQYPSLFRGEILFLVQLGQQVQSFVFQSLLLVSTLQHSPSTNVQNLRCTNSTPAWSPTNEITKSFRTIFLYFKSTTRRKAAILARQEVKEYCQKK